MSASFFRRKVTIGLVASGCMAGGTAHTQTLPAPPVSPVPVVTYEYDAEGNPTRLVQAPGVTGFAFPTTATYDTRGRAKDLTDAKSGVARFGYTGRDDLAQVTDPRNLVTQYPRNGLGDATSLVSPDTGTATHTYDAAGNLKTRTDSRGVLATHSYDALNRLTSTVVSKTGSTSLTYGWTYDQTGAGFSNGIGRLTSTAHPTGSTTYTYDPQGRVLTDIQRVNAATGANPAQVAKTVTYTYDATGNVTSILYPSGRKLVLTYTNGQLSSMALGKDATTTPVNLISQLQFSPFGGPLSWQWQMTSTTQANTRVYDASGRLIRYQLGGFVRDVTYDAADRITAYTHYDSTSGTATAAATAMNQGFGYDELGRLTTVTTATSSWSIGYDANGNRTGVTLNGTARVYATSATSNRLTSISNPTRSFGYDNAGNITTDSGGYTDTYDLANRMSTLTKAGATTTYAYDGMGRRVRKFISAGTGAGAASTVIFVYDQQGQLLGEYNSAGTALREYVWLGTTPIAIFMPDTVANNPPLVYYVHGDHLNTPRVVVDKTNAVRWRWIAEPFGTTVAETNPQGLGTFTQNLRFPGQYADLESGLNYNYFRSYDNSTGRYVQSDPIGVVGGVGTYTYVESNPLSEIDPLGLFIYRSKTWYSDIPYKGRTWERALTTDNYITGWVPYDPGRVGDDFSGQVCRVGDLGGGSSPGGRGGDGNWGRPMPRDNPLSERVWYGPGSKWGWYAPGEVRSAQCAAYETAKFAAIGWGLGRLEAVDEHFSFGLHPFLKGLHIIDKVWFPIHLYECMKPRKP